MSSMFQAVISNVRVGKEPELAYTQDGKACLKLKLLGDKWVRGRGADRETKTISFQVTFWQEKAEYLNGLLQGFTNKDNRVGVGALVTVFTNQMPEVWAFQSSTTGDILGDICLTGYDMIIHSPLARQGESPAREEPQAREIPF